MDFKKILQAFSENKVSDGDKQNKSKQQKADWGSPDELFGASSSSVSGAESGFSDDVLKNSVAPEVDESFWERIDAERKREEDRRKAEEELKKEAERNKEAERTKEAERNQKAEQNQKAEWNQETEQNKAAGAGDGRNTDTAGKKEKSEQSEKSKKSQNFNGYAPDCRFNYLQFVIDETWSIKDYFKKVYRYVEKVVTALYNSAEDHSRIEIFYGLTVIKSDIRQVTFSNGSEYTNNPEEFLETLKDTTIGGGSENGYEDIAGALKTAVKSLEMHNGPHDNRGLFLITDSEPEIKIIRLKEIEGIKVNGLRFAVAFINRPQAFAPIFKYVDSKNETALNNSKNGNKYYDFRLLVEGSIKADRDLGEIVNSIVNAISIGG